MRPLHLVALAAALLSACTSVARGDAGDEGAPDASAVDATTDDTVDAADPGDAAALQLSHTSETTTLAVGQEDNQACESWTLNNTETLYVNTVAFHNAGGMHHSNWFFVPESYYGGPDGRWRCPDRRFDEAVAAVVGGALFAQSTQSMGDTQAFPDGAALAIPPHSRIVGQLHFLNVTGQPLQTQFDLVLTPLAASDVRVRLNGFVIQYMPLSIPPHASSDFTTTCDLATTQQTQFGRPLDFQMYYALPHYHALGSFLRVEFVGGPRDGQVAFESNGRLGEPWGRTLDPPVDLTGATGLRLTCGFQNPRDTTVQWGIGDQEMCVFFAFTSSNAKWAAGAQAGATNEVLGPDDAGVVQNQSPCAVLAGPGH